MKSTHQRFFFTLACFSIGMVFLLQALDHQAGAIHSAAQVAPSRLPIFRLTTPRSDAESLRSNAEGILGVKGEAKRIGSRLSVREGYKVVDVNTKSGAIWAADQSQIWNPNLKPALPSKDRARAIAEDYLKRTNLLQRSKGQYSTISFANIGGTHAAFYDSASKKRSDRQLDIQVNYTTKIEVPRLGNLPVVGGGGEFNVTIGDQGRVIGLQGLARPIEGVETESPVVPQDRADAQFKEMTKGLKLKSFKSWLAYYSAPPSVEQKFLYPVYVYSASAYIGNELVPLRLITIPATEFGLKPKPSRTVRPRPAKAKPTRRSTIPEGEEERGIPTRDNAHASFQGSSWKEAASSFIGTSGGLGGSANNVQGFVDNMSADGWNINFVWGDGNAFESDWRANDDSWVDAADFVFYTGHANMNGWSLSNPDDGSLDFSEVGASPQNAGDIWGQQDLEWVIVAACGPLQDAVISPGGGDVFDRWDGAFDGLHQLLGYGAITFDNEEEGASVSEYAQDGETVINAWFRAAREIQPGDNGSSAPDGPIVWVGVMYVGKSGANPGNDHIWGHGSVSSDPRSPTFYVAMWTTC